MIYAKIGTNPDNSKFVCASIIPGENPEPGVMQGYDVPNYRWLKIVNDEIAIVDPAVADFSAAKAAARQRITDERDARETQGFPYMGKTMQSDERSVQRITVAVQAAQAAISTGSPFLLTWICADNSELTVDAAQMVGMAVALANNAAGIHAISKTLKTQIEAATDQAELGAVVWP